MTDDVKVEDLEKQVDQITSNDELIKITAERDELLVKLEAALKANVQLSADLDKAKKIISDKLSSLKRPEIEPKVEVPKQATIKSLKW